MKSRPPSRKAEIDLLARRSHLTAQFLAARDRIEIDGWRATIDGAAAHGKLSPMRLLADELSHMTRVMLSAHEQEMLARQLRDLLGVDLEAEVHEVNNRIEAIQTRGEVRTDTEYSLIRARIEELEGDPSQASLVQQLRDILGKYGV